MPYSEKIEKILSEKGIKPGDRILLKRRDFSIEGILLPREEVDFGDCDILVIKLDNGYNVGFKIDDGEILKLEGSVELGKFKTLEKVEQDESLPPVSIFSTGGTISARIDYYTGGVSMLFTPEEIFYNVPEALKIAYLRRVERLFGLASEDMTHREWSTMARKIAESLSQGDAGVLLLHGTDTMHYTSAALSFMLRGLNAPVVLVGSQRSSDRGSRDSDMNIICGLHAATKANLGEVVVCMHAESGDTFNYLIRGTRVRKMHSTRRDAFKPINSLPLAKVWPDGRIEMITDGFRPRSKDPPNVDDAFEPKTALVKAYPGSSPEIVDFLIDKGYRGIVIEGTGMGHVPTEPLDKNLSWVRSIKRGVEEGVIFAMTTQCVFGRVNPYVYRNARIMAKLGVVYCEDMLSEVAYVKLGWLLGHGFDNDTVKKLMLHSFAGEISERSLYSTYTL
ncbi:MAG: Glu-tRNA(Gln) amidotransferase subunit GatD [Thermoproteota archaeon]|nr:Glu-tRNA(Gln) amidotransferase subunit GatD [Candidatus Brockarchaeota archaeon]